MTTNHSHRHFRSRQRPTRRVELPCRYDLPFVGFYAYSPRGETEVSKRSRELCGRIKSGSASWLKSYSSRATRELAQNLRFEGFFSAGSVLVPVPESESSGRTPRWVARRLAVMLHELGLGRETWFGLRRIRPVARSSAAWRWERPSVEEHHQSLAVIPSSSPPSEIVLVDDVITKGRTLMASALRLSDAFPNATIRAFALVRTMGLVFDVDRLFDPCVGAIHWDGKDAHREP